MNKALIVSVGGSAEPIVKSIIHHKPQYLYFFASQGTNDVTVKVKELLGDAAKGISFKVTLVDNENDLLECHEKALITLQSEDIKALFQNDVVVDYTGGTKNMSVALALAAIEKGYNFSYVGGEKRTKDGVGIVLDGHEKIYSNINPWDYLAVKERREASLFFNSYQFKSCHNLFLQLSNNASKRKSVYKKLAIVVDAYYHWDLFRHVDSIELFKKAKLSELIDDNDPKIAEFARISADRVTFLEKVAASTNKGKISSEPLLLDLYSNAERRYLEGKIDDAILRLYRLVEMMAQYQLFKNYGIDTSNVAVDKIPESIREEYRNKYRDSKSGKIQIPQNAAYILLKELGDPLGATFEEHQSSFRDIQSSRNDSYLAHGFKSSTENVYIKLRNFVVSLQLVKLDELPDFPKLNI